MKLTVTTMQFFLQSEVHFVFVSSSGWKQQQMFLCSQLKKPLNPLISVFLTSEKSKGGQSVHELITAEVIVNLSMNGPGGSDTSQHE